jgi:hypothetical protein
MILLGIYSLEETECFAETNFIVMELGQSKLTPQDGKSLITMMPSEDYLPMWFQFS